MAEECSTMVISKIAVDKTTWNFFTCLMELAEQNGFIILSWLNQVFKRLQFNQRYSCSPICCIILLASPCKNISVISPVKCVFFILISMIFAPWFFASTGISAAGSTSAFVPIIIKTSAFSASSNECFFANWRNRLVKKNHVGF